MILASECTCVEILAVTLSSKHASMIIVNVQISVQNNFGNHSGSNDWIGQDVVELSGDLHWIHNVHLSSIIGNAISFMLQ